MFAELWALRLDRPLTEAETGRLWTALPPERRARLEAARRLEKQQEILCAYWLLQEALGERYGWTALPAMAYGPLGKPVFPENPAVCFNLSHTAGAALVGLSDRPIGVDIERLHPVRQALLDRLGARTEESFFRSWVCREARAKRTGTPVQLGPETAPEVEERICWLETFPGYAACAAGETPPTAPVHLWTLDRLL